jgi:DNA polymerase elongation subunit (family B)
VYAALKYTLKGGHKANSIEDFESCVDMKGIDAVRRDRSKLVKMLSENILDALLIKKDLGAAMNNLKETVNQVAEQKASLDLLVLSKSLKSTYASENQPHVKAWKRMIQRGSQDAPEIGSRMPYIITEAKNGKQGPIYDRTEHPDYVAQAKLKYCARYYLENARDVIERLIGPTGQTKQVSEIFEKALINAQNKSNNQMTLQSFFGLKRKLNE